MRDGGQQGKNGVRGVGIYAFLRSKCEQKRAGCLKEGGETAERERGEKKYVRGRVGRRRRRVDDDAG